MADSLTNSADGLLVLLLVIALVVFFLFGPHKVYESIFGALVGMGAYLFIHEITFVSPDFTRTIFFGNWLVENRGTLLWLSKGSMVLLFFAAPITVGINVAGAVRGTVWFLLKTLVLSVFFICFGVVIFFLLSAHTGVFGEVSVIPQPLGDMAYFKNAISYTWIVERRYSIIFLAFLLGIYKILFSHWMGRLGIISGALYLKGNTFFGKKELDSTTPIQTDDHHASEGDHHNDH